MKYYQTLKRNGLLIYAVTWMDLENVLVKSVTHKRIFLFMYVCMYLFMAALGLPCCVRAFSSCSEQGLLFVAVCGLLIVVTSLVAEHGP